MSPAEKHEYIYELFTVQNLILATWPDKPTRQDALARMLVAHVVACSETPQELAANAEDMYAHVARYVQEQLASFHAIRASADAMLALVVGGGNETEQ